MLVQANHNFGPAEEEEIVTYINPNEEDFNDGNVESDEIVFHINQ